MSDSGFEEAALEALVARARSGDAAALAEYVQAVRPRLLAFIERRVSTGLRRKVEPDDILQEVTIDAVRGAASVDLSRREPFSWLCQLVERRVIDAHRHHFGAQKRDAAREVPLSGGGAGGDHSADLLNLLVNSLTTPSQAFSRQAREARLLAALAQLAEPEQAALRMRYVENLPSKEIAQKLGRTDAAVRVMLTRSLKKLQALLGEES